MQQLVGSLLEVTVSHQFDSDLVREEQIHNPIERSSQFAHREVGPKGNCCRLEGCQRRDGALEVSSSAPRLSKALLPITWEQKENSRWLHRLWCLSSGSSSSSSSGAASPLGRSFPVMFIHSPHTPRDDLLGGQLGCAWQLPECRRFQSRCFKDCTFAESGVIHALLIEIVGSCSWAMSSGVCLSLTLKLGFLDEGMRLPRICSA
ncbi:unnamed protein product [Durusdinium trenchii]|uniref:Uncharacterized protein n=1 Tax=Durusdinium trenchii TaxID=1381693 RepID=A0ABP0HRA7_9DINO